jgi:hypothetical protein
MRFLRTAVSFVTTLALLVHTTRVARAEETAPAAPADPVGGPTVFVHFDAGSGVRLEVDTAAMPTLTTSHWQFDEGWSWSLACEAPCDRLLSLGHEYRLVGPGILPSGTFYLDASPGQSVVVTAKTASATKHGVGVLVIVLGSLAIPGGLFVILLANLQCIGGCSSPLPGPNVGGEVAGGLIALAGVGAVAGGLVLALGNEQSRQTQQILRPKPSERPATAWLREPVWRDSIRDWATGATRVGIPILSRSF